jgi:hypothetical protein
MVGFMSTSFSNCISTPIPSDISPDHFDLGVSILQNYENVAHFSTNCTGCKRSDNPSTSTADPNSEQTEAHETQQWQVSEDLPFIPSWLWSGGTTYAATVTPNSAGCVVEIQASKLYTSTNTWRVVRGSPPDDDEGMALEGSKELAEGSEWFIQTASQTDCNKTFAGFVKGNLVKGTRGMHEVFVKRLREEIKRKEGQGGS